MKARLIYISLLIVGLVSILESKAQEIYNDGRSIFKVSGYLRTGVGRSEDGSTQAHFQMPGALNKYSLGNQADTYGELEFNYKYYFDAERTKSIDVVWMNSIYEDFGSKEAMVHNIKEQLHVKINNIFGKGETIWGGNRFYDRKAIHMLDRQWLNPGQGGWGFGVENLLNRSTEEDLKFAVWRFKKDEVVSYKNGLEGNIYNYTADLRWVNKPISERMNINFAANYSYRAANDMLGYSAEQGFGLFSWVDYKKKHTTNTTALLIRQGANITTNHWTGITCRENPANDNYVTRDLGKSYSVELNNNYLYDDHKRWSLNVVMVAVARNYGTTPYNFVDGEAQYIEDRGRMVYWLTAGARGSRYLSDKFKLTLEYSHEYINNKQLDVAGHLNKVTFSPELSLSKGFYSRPALRPFVNYAFWSDELRGQIGNSPAGAPFGNQAHGLTYGAQFEIWW